MRVFFSHSGRDRAWILPTVDQLKRSGIEVYTFEHDSQPGMQVIPKIQAALNACDLMVTFITRHSMSSNWVQQEIGWALGLHKAVVPLVEDVVARDEALAMLDGTDYILFSATAPERALDELKVYLTRSALQGAHVLGGAYSARSEARATTTETPHWDRTPPLLTMSVQINVDVVLGMLIIVLGAYLLYVGVQEMNAASGDE